MEISEYFRKIVARICNGKKKMFSSNSTNIGIEFNERYDIPTCIKPNKLT